MDKNSTLNDLTQFYNNEKELSKFLIDMKENSEKFYNSVSNQTIENIMNYSKALSVRDSKMLGSIDFLLN